MYRDEAELYPSVGKVTGSGLSGSGVLISDRWVLTAGHISFGKTSGTFNLGGIDYAIHVTLSLRRTHGDYQELWQGTGKALLFCGASNVIGFGSLIFSSSDALVSLGIVSVIGIVLSMGISIFLLPGWRTSPKSVCKDP